MINRRILIAVGSISDRELLREILTQLNKRSTIGFASTACDVMQSVESSAAPALPDVMIIECEFMGMSMEKLFQLLQKTPGGSLILKVIWSAPTDKKFSQRFHELGAHLLLPASLRPSDLKMALANLLLSFPKEIVI